MGRESENKTVFKWSYISEGILDGNKILPRCFNKSVLYSIPTCM